jgi:hypothetical protein
MLMVQMNNRTGIVRGINNKHSQLEQELSFIAAEMCAQLQQAESQLENSNESPRTVTSNIKHSKSPVPEQNQTKHTQKKVQGFKGSHKIMTKIEHRDHESKRNGKYKTKELGQ